MSEKYPLGKIILINYDAKSRLSQIADAQRTYVNNLQYQGVGNSLSQMTFSNGTVQTFTMNDRMRMFQKIIFTMVLWAGF